MRTPAHKLSTVAEENTLPRIEEQVQEAVSFERCMASRFALLCSIARHGTGDWVAVSRSIDAMDNRQCRERYEIHEKPSLSFAQPSEEELLELAELYFRIKAEVGQTRGRNIYCDLREQTFDRYHRSNMWLKQQFMRMEKTGELERIRQRLEAMYGVE
ncbi:hypothetical protein J8273_1004 [Carpediemonas membranifera]|uniref:Uncharacterized protein n=1 Tax=Carpediemonas membranifera TaxID=201153 RepID=A0A8J6AX77_9EUKA|nr:hypothetical protein J8273_1004 [Carpediemonas membranifera]|eukprot:KAG9397096.1 hypothetical protein J8273_1004 [Carpediemonas membranifera]